jgi:glycosyltransferase involved in cell wall biosynthesis
VAFDGRSLTAPAPRGWDRYIIGLVRELGRQGVEVTLFHRASEPLHPSHLARLTCRVTGLADRGGLHWEQIAVPRELRRGGFDLFHAAAERGVPLPAPCPVVFTIHSATTSSYQRLIREGLLPGQLSDYLGPAVQSRPRRLLLDFYHRMQVRRADHILTPSEFSRGELIELMGISPGRVTTTPLAVDSVFQEAPSAPAARAATLAGLGISRPFLLYVGGYERHKNVTGLIEMFRLVRDRRPDVSLVMVGTTRVADEALRCAAELGADARRRIVFLVDVSEELKDLYDEAELLVTMSWRESFCLPALEAMTRGLRVVASRWGAGPEVIGDGGCLIDPRDAPAACDVILKMLTSADRSRESDRARRAASAFSWHTTAHRTIQIYRRLAQSRQMTAQPANAVKIFR